MSDKITVTRALAELKHLDSKIEKEIAKYQFADVHQAKQDKTAFCKVTPKEFEKQTKEEYQSVIDLISRRKRLKAAIIKSNAKERVDIAGSKMTVAEAIEYKSSINLERILLNKLRADAAACNKTIDDNEDKLNENILNMLEQALGADKKHSKDDYETIAKPFYEANKLSLVDPLGILDKIDKLEDKIDSFNSEVDFVLSESNSRTEITV